jgi:hypothetical protein
MLKIRHTAPGPSTITQCDILSNRDVPITNLPIYALNLSKVAEA